MSVTLMDKEVIFDKAYPVNEDGFIQIGEELIRVPKPRKIAEILYRHFNFQDIKPKKPSQATFGSVVENLDKILNRGWTDDSLNSHRPFKPSQMANEYGFSRQALIPYVAALSALKKDRVISEETVETKPREQFVDVKKEKWLKKYGYLVEKFKSRIRKPEGENQLKIYDQANAVLYDIFNNILKMSPVEFLQLNMKTVDPQDKLEKQKAWLREKRDEFHKKEKLKAEKAGEKYVGAGWKRRMAILRPFVEKTSDVTIGDTPTGDPYSQNIKSTGYGGETLVGKYSHLKAEPQQIETIEECLQKMDVDGYFLFLLNLEMGLREKEALTISALPPEPHESGVREMTMQGKKVFEVTVRTRKGDWHGEKIHRGIVQRPELVELMAKRVNEVKEGLKQTTQKKADKFGIKLEVINPRTHKLMKNRNHSLIGNDDQYYEIRLLQEPAPKQRTAQVEHYRQLEENLRECYKQAGLTEDYWTKKPFHAMRHIFAHYWLIKTDYDYEFVADLGHWKATTELKRSYGQMPPEIFYDKVIAYHSNEYVTVDQFIQNKKLKESADEVKRVYGAETEQQQNQEAKKLGIDK